MKDSGGTVVSEQQFGYDGSLPGNGSPSVGELTLSRQVDGAQTIDTAYIHDVYGNPTEAHLNKNYGTTGSQPGGNYLTYSVAYDTSLKTYAVSVTDPLNHVTQQDYDFGLGLPTVATDPNNNATTTTYDGLGRVKAVTYPNYSQPNIKYSYATPPISAPFAVQAQVWDESASVYRSAWQVFDGLGRVIQTQGPAETAGDLSLTDTSYNAQGLALNSGLPRKLTGAGGSYFAPSWASVPHTTTGYDALGRMLSVAYADGSADSYSYSALRTTHIDRNNHQKVQQADAFGRLAKVEEYTGSGTYSLYATTTYAYDPRDLLKQITDAQGSQITVGYNGFGRKISMSDPDMGSWSYGYDVLGNMASQTDARTCVTSVSYDDLNRPTNKTYSGPGACATTPAVTYSYDSTTANNQGIGHRTGMIDGSGSSSWFYNRLGQATNQTQNIDGTNYPLTFTLDAFNRPLTQSLPSGETLNYGYNAMGALSSLSGTSTYVSQIHYSAGGQVTDQQLGNGLLQQSCYDANTLRLTKLRTYSGSLQSCIGSVSNARLDLSYSYQPNGNVSQVVDATQNETINYTYDELDRLLSASGANNKNYGYNTNGNIDNVVTTPTLTAVSAGQYHSCALTASGGVKCWGLNDWGQLGDGTQTQRLTPVDVSGLTSGVVAIAAGGRHTCALTSGGGVKCWGYNVWGQLGNNSTINSFTPVDVSGLSSGVAAITAGDNHTCALLTNGGVKCWGSNAFGALGDGTATNRSTPVNVSGLTSGVAAVTAGGGHTCAVTTSGGAKCWGKNDSAQIGDGTVTDRLTPVNVSGLTSGVAAITAGGEHSCALTTNGGTKCWGANFYGEVGDGTTNPAFTPVNVLGLNSGVTALTTGFIGACALTTSGGIKCWGNNSYGGMGNGTSGGISASPVDANFSTLNGYSYDGHAVTSLSSGATYTYDANGNMTARLEGGLTYAQTFDAENRLVSVTVGGQLTQFVYDGDGNLVKKIKPDGSKTIYVGNIYEVDKTSGGAVLRTLTYYPAGGAVRINSTVYYVLKDRLGSAYATTDASGTVVGQMRYYASGETRVSTGNMFTDRLFTGQRQMAGLGIYQFGARFYSPNLGRFLSADSMLPSISNPQALNRYSYAMNNPIRYSDPSGHMAWQGDGGDGCYSSCTTTGGTTGTTTTTTSSGGGGGGGGSDGDTVVGGSGSDANQTTTVLAPITNPAAESGANWGAAGSTVFLFRAVSNGELQDILNSQAFRPNPSGLSMDAKWFWETLNGAKGWQNQYDLDAIVKVTAPDEIMQFVSSSSENMDNLGAAVSYIDEGLDALNELLIQIEVLSEEIGPVIP